MSNPYEMFNTDENLEAGEGVELDYGGYSITIHRAGGANRKFSRILTAKMAPYRRQMDNGTLDDEVANKVLAECYAEAVIIGWKDVKDKEGKNMPFNKKNCMKLMLDLPDLFREIQGQSNNISNFRTIQTEEDTKNSSKS